MGAEENAAVVRRGFAAFDAGASTRSTRCSTRAPCGTLRGDPRWRATTRAVEATFGFLGRLGRRQEASGRTGAPASR